ncbi:MAG: carbon-nitrogen hydrolase family protein [Promethearchaeota archaeon]
MSLGSLDKDILKIGACSMAAVPGETEENINKIKKWTEKGIKEKLDILLFPELSLSGYWPRSELYYEAQPRDGPAINELISFLGELNANIAISVGLAESYGNAIYNTQILLNREGIISYYRKTHWPAAEVETWSCGNHYPVANYMGFKIGTAICYDNNFPEVHRIYGIQGADVVLSPYAYGSSFSFDDLNSQKLSIQKWKNKEKMFLRAAAAANYLWIIAVVGGGIVKDYLEEQQPGKGFKSTFPGVILFIDPNGQVVKESPDDKVEERLISMNISRLSNLEIKKGGNNFFKNRRPWTYSKITELP